MKRLVILAVSMAVRGWDLVRAAWPGRPSHAAGVVLYYHSVKPRQRQRFARQMDHLLRGASLFQVGKPKPVHPRRRRVAVTFDDGFRSVVENAVPELANRGIPFTVFVPSGSLGVRPTWVRDPEHSSWEEEVVSARELRALASEPLATIGSHSISHPNFLRLDPACSREELVSSKAALEAVTGQAVDLFSFPHGAHDAASIELAREAGYKHVYTIAPTLIRGHDEPFCVGRVAVDPDDWPIEFALKIAGAYRWRTVLRSRGPAA